MPALSLFPQPTATRRNTLWVLPTARSLGHRCRQGLQDSCQPRRGQGRAQRFISPRTPRAEQLGAPITSPSRSQPSACSDTPAFGCEHLLRPCSNAPGTASAASKYISESKAAGGKEIGFVHLARLLFSCLPSRQL